MYHCSLFRYNTFHRTTGRHRQDDLAARRTHHRCLANLTQSYHLHIDVQCIIDGSRVESHVGFERSRSNGPSNPFASEVFAAIRILFNGTRRIDGQDRLSSGVRQFKLDRRTHESKVTTML